MFKKKPTIKSLAPLRSSDRRKVVDQIMRDYTVAAPPAPVASPAPAPAEGGGQAADDAAAAGSLAALRNGLLPEGAQSARFTTTVGAEGKVASGTVYAGQHEGDELRVLWLRLDDRLVPTVYTLWRHPGLVPLLHTPDAVLQKMRGGADLMTPGLARGPPFPPGATKGAVVAVAAYERPGVPVVLGECAIDVCALQDVRGQKGNAVRGLHWEGDEIWGWGGAGAKAPENLEGWYEDGGAAAPAPAAEMQALGLEEAAAADVEPAVNGDGSDGVAEYADRPARTWTTKEIDDAFKRAFLFALHEARSKHKGEPGHGLSFPIQQSQFTSTLILPYLPTFSPDDTAALQIKKTSWKSIQKFIKALDKESLLKSKVRNGGETVVTDIDFEDRQVQAFEPYRLPKKGPIAAAGSAQPSDAKPDGSDPAVGQKLQIVHLLKPRASLHPVFAVAQADPHALHLPSELKLVVNRYLEAEDLVRASDRARVTLDPVLVAALYPAADPESRAPLAAGHVARDALLARAVAAACAPYYLVQRTAAGDAPRDEDRNKAVSGAPPRARITLETRSGNKTATRVSGLEVFSVGAAQLADELQKVCAGATSVAQVPGSSPKKPLLEVMVQGPQRDAVLKALEKRGVRASWVDVIDKTKKKK